MGFTVEYNWYLVIQNKEDISVYDDSSFKYIIKSGNRMYPLNMPIPLIVKNVGCIDMIEVVSVTNTPKGTIVLFDDKISMSINQNIKDHYYDIYLKIKNQQNK